MGEGKWTAPLGIDEFGPKLPSGIQKFQLQQKYILLNANSQTAGSQNTLAEILFAICDSNPDNVEPLMDKLEAMLKGEEFDSLRQLFIQMINYAILKPAEINPVDKTINFTEAKEMMTAKAQKWRQDVLNEGILQGISMPEAKAQKWRQDVLNEGILQGISMPEAKAQKWRQDVEKMGRNLERNEIAYEMLKAGKTREEIIQFTRITEAELDKNDVDNFHFEYIIMNAMICFYQKKTC